MFRRMRVKRITLLVVVSVSLLAASSVWAKQPEGSPNTGLTSAGGGLYKGEAAIEQYAEMMGISVTEAKQEINAAHKLKANNSPEPAGVGGHFSLYIPACSNPPHGAAYALFETGPGPLTVQFHGNRLWVINDSCGEDACVFLAWAGLPFSGDSIWVYSVTAAFSSDISHWCSGGIITAKQPTE